MNKSNRTVLLSLALVFSSGVLVGGFGHWLYTTATVRAMTQRTPEDFRRQYVEEMNHRLKLDPDQLAQLNSVLDDTRAQFRTLKEQHRAEIRQIQKQQTERINSFLRPDQQAEYARMRKEREERMKMRGNGGGC